MHFVKGVEYISGYKLMLTFEDGSVRLTDLEPHLNGEVFEPLKEVNYFRAASVNSELDTIVWENGADRPVALCQRRDIERRQVAGEGGENPAGEGGAEECGNLIDEDDSGDKHSSGLSEVCGAARTCTGSIGFNLGK